MGRTMAPAAASTLITHLQDFNITTDEYDLILTGDLSTDNFNDAGLMLYDIEKQHVFAGGSGCGCVTLVTLSYVINALRIGIYHKVLIIATGALMNPIMVAQNETIPAIAHAIALERSFE